MTNTPFTSTFVFSPRSYPGNAATHSAGFPISANLMMIIPQRHDHRLPRSPLISQKALSPSDVTGNDYCLTIVKDSLQIEHCKDLVKGQLC